VVEADSEKGFYLKYGFIQFSQDQNRLFIAMETVEEMFNDADTQ